MNLSYFFSKTRIALVLNTNINNIEFTKINPKTKQCLVVLADFTVTYVSLKDMIKTRKLSQYQNNLSIIGKGLQKTILDDGFVNKEHTWTVKNTSKDSEYVVKENLFMDRFECNCQDYKCQIQQLEITEETLPTCKHIYCVAKELNITTMSEYKEYFKQQFSKLSLENAIDKRFDDSDLSYGLGSFDYEPVYDEDKEFCDFLRYNCYNDLY